MLHKRQEAPGHDSELVCPVETSRAELVARVNVMSCALAAPAATSRDQPLSRCKQRDQSQFANDTSTLIAYLRGTE